MPALTSHFKLVNLSYVDGCITFYPNFQYYDDMPDLRNCLKAIVKACGEKEFVVNFLEDHKPSKENLEFTAILKDIQFGEENYSRYIQRNDTDHWLYHKDNFNYNDSHYHVKFQSILTPAQIKVILDVCVEHHLITPTEQRQFFQALDDRYIAHHEKLTQAFVGDKTKDTETILTHITRCEDNDVLADIHRYLLQPQFDYLRKSHSDEHWQGTLTSNGDIGKGSYEWASIEKLMSFQIIENINTRCRHLDQRTAASYAEELNHSLRFFAIKRKDNTSHATNKAFEDFKAAKLRELENKYFQLLQTYHVQPGPSMKTDEAPKPMRL